MAAWCLICILITLPFVCLCEVLGPDEMSNEEMSHDPRWVPANDTHFPVINCTTQYRIVFGSDRSSRNADVLSFVRSFGCSVQVCLEQSIFIFLGQRAIRELSESTQSIKIRVIQSVRLVSVNFGEVADQSISPNYVSCAISHNHLH